ncbi:MAG TPA: CBS domain-containing protein [Anaerolineae bacterium]|nr:CBS domain-containing protein [Anaerolineae bacterium]
MLVREQMSTRLILCSPELPVAEALEQMKKERIRRMPVTDKNGKLIGIVSDKDLLEASPSPVTSLSVWEVTYLLSKIKVGDVMTKQVITVTEDTTLEDAARILVDNKIGGLPVVNEAGAIVGIITETDIFKAFIDVLGARKKGVRVTTLVADRKGQLAKITTAIAAAEGNIVALVETPATDSTTYEVMFKVINVPLEKLIEVVKPHVIRITDVREA